MASEIAARAESILRATARGYARLGMPSAEEGLLDDALVGTTGRVLGVQRCREIIREEFGAAQAAADARMAGIRAARSEVPITPDGLAEVLDQSGWRLAWNTTARRVVARKGDEGDWLDCDGLTRDQMLEDCAAAAILPRRSVGDAAPWRIRGARLEDRLLRVVAARNQIEGAGSEVYQAVREWAGGKSGVRLSLTDVLAEAKCLQRYESASRAPKSVFADAAQALEDLGWRRKSVRVDGDPRYQWVAPGERRRKATPIAAFLGRRRPA